MEGIETVKVCGKMHVVANQTQERNPYPDANYYGTGKAFVGILKEEESIEQFIKRKKRIHKKFNS